MNVGGRLGTSATQDLVLLGGLALAGYVVYQIVQGIKTTTKPFTDAAATVADIANQTGELGDRMPDPQGATRTGWYDPTQRTVFFYILTFPDGSQHMVWSSDVQPDGSFSYNNAPYRIGVDRAGGLRAYAMPNTPALSDLTPDFGITAPTGGWS